VVDENAAGEVSQAVACMRELCRAGAGVLAVHHPRKSGGENGTAVRGSGALPGAVDVIVELRQYASDDEADRRRVLTCRGRFEDHPPETVAELGTDGVYRIIGDRTEARRADLAETILSILPGEGVGLTVEEVCEAWPGGKPPGLRNMRSTLNQGFSRDFWHRQGTGNKGDPYRYRRFDSGSQNPEGEPEPKPPEPSPNGLYGND